MNAPVDTTLIIATYCSAVVATGCALALGARIAALSGLRRIVWFGLASISLGAGLWTMHHVGSRAMGLVSALDAAPGMALMSWLVTVAVALFALHMIARSRLNLSTVPTLVAAVAIGGFLTVMQQVGIANSGAIHVTPGAGGGLIAAAIGIGLLLATLAALLADGALTAQRSIRAREDAEVQRIHRLAYYDEVTGLPNRSLFTEKLLKQLVDASHRDTAPFGLVYAELRDFRLLLQRYGEERINAVLKAITERLSSELMSGDLLARLSSDGLILFVREQTDRDTATAVSRVCALLSTPIDESGDSFRFTWGIGHSRYPESGQSTQALIRAATTVQRQIGTEAPALASSTRPRFALAS
jgi:diguanylate cyclase (GGDEF)-like protein